MGEKRPYRFIISGGGTGGHIYPAIAIANELRYRYPDCEIKFVGALGRMEMEKVPKAGYDIIGLPIAGIQRRLTWKNLLVPFKLLKSMSIARKLIKEFQPDVAIGVGGYASGPLLKAACANGVSSLIQEQNSYAGLTNKLLAKDVSKICVAYEGMEAYFPQSKITLTGNPVRKDIRVITISKKEASTHFGLDPNKKTVLIIGGSLGARTINESIKDWSYKLVNAGYQLLWQTGGYYYKGLKNLNSESVIVKDFIYEMDKAYAVADVVVSRAGALSVSELCLVGKPIILVPSPNVSEDHQTKNAMALVNKEAAILVKDIDSNNQLVDALLKLLQDEKKQFLLSNNIKQLAKPNATVEIVNEIDKLLRPWDFTKKALKKKAKNEQEEIKSEPQSAMPLSVSSLTNDKTDSTSAVSLLLKNENEFQLKRVKNVYLIGIGGIGMSALARWFLANGCKVGGYDRSPSVVTDQLVQLGAEVVFDDRVESINTRYKSIDHENLVIYTPAVRNDHPQLYYFKSGGATVLKRSRVLGLISQEFKTLAVAGTHGKTTTSSLLAHLLYSANVSMVGFMGGLIQNYNSNFISNIKKGEETYVVVEADEFDRSFLTLFPDYAIVTNTDADHLDIYGSEEVLNDAFNEFLDQVKPAGKVFYYSGCGEFLSAKNKESYGLKNAGHIATNIRVANGNSLFDYQNKGKVVISDISLKMPGYHNILNATAAISVALEIGISPDKIKEGIASFGGVKRRFEFIYENEKIVFIDDYAHHPTELEALLNGVKAFWSDKKITIVFQPHLFSRTRDFMKDFARTLSLADQVILLDIYPARELPIDGITSDTLLELITVENKKKLSKQEAIKEAQNIEGVLLTIGAGDIDGLVQPIKEQLIAISNV